MRSKPRTIIRAAMIALSLLIAGLSMQGDGHAAERRAPAPTEYQVKAAFVNNFIKFVEWPVRDHVGQTPDDRIRFCVLGDLPDKAIFEALDGQEILGKRMSLAFLQEPEEIGECQVLFLSSTVSSSLPEVLKLLRGRPTLTIGDTEGYARRGVMINMYIDNKRVRFEINAETAGAAGLKISAKLLSLAGEVYGVSRTGK